MPASWRTLKIGATSVLIHLVGGVALLLWGLRMVRTGVMRAFGGDLRAAIGAALCNRFAAFGCGLGVTAVLQSSTATALMTASFAARGFFSSAMALALMLGADVGTAMVAQLASVNPALLSPVLITLGVAAFSSTLATRWRDLGRAGVGLGMMLLALKLIVASTHPLRDSMVMHEVLAALSGERVLAIAIAAALTWIVHSSLAVILLAISLADTGLVPVPLALTIVLGANLGGALPALVATWGSDAGARRVTIGNAAFRTIGVALAVPLLGVALAELPNLEPEIGRQIANFHLFFNLGLAVLFLPLVGLAGRLVDRLVASRESAANPAVPRYLDESALESPTLALAAAARETLRMGDALESMLRDCITVFKTDDRKLADEIVKRDDVVDRLCEDVKHYLLRISPEAMGEKDQRRAMEILQFATNLEHAGDIVDKNLIELAIKKMKNRLRFSEEGMAEIEALHVALLDTLRLALAVFMQGDARMARQMIAEKVEFRERERRAAERHIERLRGRNPDTIETSSLHLDVLRDLKRIHSHFVAVAYPLLEAEGALRESRLAPEKPARKPRPATPGNGKPAEGTS
ncbi:MAG: Na/Pi cotransporter family protein [Rhodospirillales bacterium]|nr:Na/Pi cotransporter family protein [Rhodospirillales bacterium]